MYYYISNVILFDILFEDKLTGGFNSHNNGGSNKATPYPLIDLEANKNQHDFSDLIQ